MSVNEKMTALANGIRELSGTTSKKGIEEMASDVNAANTEVSEQTDLIAQILSKVDSLPEAGSGSSGGGEMGVAYISGGYTHSFRYTVVFEEGMTWADFIGSKYNTCMATAAEIAQILRVYPHNPRFIGFVAEDWCMLSMDTTSSGTTVLLTNAIIDGHIYGVYDD